MDMAMAMAMGIGIGIGMDMSTGTPLGLLYISPRTLWILSPQLRKVFW
jgi:hypothetical protein